jgi:hypothetical protein
MRYKSRFYQSLDLYLIPKARFILHTNNKIHIVYQNIDLYHTPKPIIIRYSKTVSDINLAFGMRYKSRYWYPI